MMIMMTQQLGNHLCCVSSGSDPGAGRRQGGGASFVRFTKWTNQWQGSTWAFPGSHRNHWESVGTPVCSKHHEEDQQPAGHHKQINSGSHNALLPHELHEDSDVLRFSFDLLLNQNVQMFFSSSGFRRTTKWTVTQNPLRLMFMLWSAGPQMWQQS